MPTQHKKTYTVTISNEKGMLVARDAEGDWRAKGDTANYDAVLHGDFARYMFHLEEIESSEMQANGTCVAVIREW
jgi:hypothetical protein